MTKAYLQEQFSRSFILLKITFLILKFLLNLFIAKHQVQQLAFKYHI